MAALTEGSIADLSRIHLARIQLSRIQLSRIGMGWRMRAGLAALALGGALAAVPNPALAQDELAAANDGPAAYSASASARARETYPALSGELKLEFKNRFAYHSQGDDAQSNNLFAELDTELGLQFTESLSIQSQFTLEQAEEKVDGGFDGEQLFAEQLFVKWESEGLALYGGKFNTHFGRAFDFLPGPFAEDFPEQYELAERVGVGTTLERSSERFGTYVLSAEAFTADTSNLSRAVLRKRSKLRRGDGGPSNTGRLNSFTVGVEGSEIPKFPGLTYNVGFAYQASDRSDDQAAVEAEIGNDIGRPERSYVAGLTYAFSAAELADFELLSEFVYVDNGFGENDRIRRFLTVGATADLAQAKGLRLGLSYTLLNDDVRAQRDNNDFLFQAVAGYFRELGNGGRLGELGFETAFVNIREENQRSGEIGFRLVWTRGF